jgi:hypothetical protein
VTLTEALFHLALRVGRTSSPWRPGMRVIRNDVACRLAWQDSEHWHGSYNSDEMPRHGGWLRIRHADMAGYAPDLTDAATVGVLAALARQAWDVPEMYAHPYGRGWSCFVWNAEGQRTWNGDTEGEAWAAVIIAAAERCKTPAE